MQNDTRHGETRRYVAPIVGRLLLDVARRSISVWNAKRALGGRQNE